MANESVSAQQVVNDFSSALKEAETLLEQVGTQAGEKAQSARIRLEQKLRDARHKLADLEEAARDRTKAAARAADDYVHEHPWQSIAIAAALGVLVGLLINRR